MVRALAGKAGQNTADCAPSSSISASATGPMLPASVESKVEQYLKRIWWAPPRRRARALASDCATASAAGAVRDLSETTMASASGRAAADAGTPIVCTTLMPARCSISATSVAPVRSSATTPISMSAGLDAVQAVGGVLGGEEHHVGLGRRPAGMHDVGGDVEHRAGLRRDRLAADDGRERALDDVDPLLVGMAVRLGAGAGRHAHQGHHHALAFDAGADGRRVVRPALDPID